MIAEMLNKIINGDCLDVMQIIPDESIDLIVTDPPYNFQSSGGGGFLANKTYHKEISQSFGNKFDPIEYLEASVRVMKKYNAYWWCNKDLLPVYLNWAVDKGFLFNVLTWHKNNPPPMTKNTFLPDTEYCIQIKQSGACFNNGLHIKLYTKYWITSIQKKLYPHPTVKPINIIKNHVLLSSPINGVVLDPFVGSGTTAVACKQLNRSFIGIDKNKKYCELADRRLAQEYFSFIENTMNNNKSG